MKTKFTRPRQELNWILGEGEQRPSEQVIRRQNELFWEMEQLENQRYKQWAVAGCPGLALAAPTRILTKGDL